MIKRLLPFLSFALLFAPASTAQDWSAGFATGPFAFGDFVERTLRATTGSGESDRSKVVMSARTRPGAAIDIERRFSPRFALRLEGTFTESPVTVKGEDGSGVALDAGTIDIATFMAPLVFRVNPRGSIQFHLLAGPAHAIYHIRRRPAGATQITLFEGTRTRWGLAAGGGVTWWWSERFGLEGQAIDVATASPFRREDFAASAHIDIPRTHNFHSTVGVRWRF